MLVPYEGLEVFGGSARLGISWMLVPYEGLEGAGGSGHSHSDRACWSPMRGWKAGTVLGRAGGKYMLVPYEGLEDRCQIRLGIPGRDVGPL